MNEYGILIAQCESFADVPHPISGLCNILSVLYWQIPNISWTGLYYVSGTDIYLGPFVGKPACMAIPWGKGVVGTCAATDVSIIVPDVDAFAGHIACDSASRSEIVLPLHNEKGEVVAVLDLDSPQLGNFSSELELALKKISRVLEGLL